MNIKTVFLVITILSPDAVCIGFSEQITFHLVLISSGGRFKFTLGIFDDALSPNSSNLTFQKLFLDDSMIITLSREQFWRLPERRWLTRLFNLITESRVSQTSYSKPKTVLSALSRKYTVKLQQLKLCFDQCFLIFVWFHLLEGGLRFLVATNTVKVKNVNGNRVSCLLLKLSNVLLFDC